MENKFINMIPCGNTPVYHLSQNDKNCQIRCSLYDGTPTKVLNGAESVVLRYKKPDKAIGFLNVANTSNSYVDITIPDTMTDKAGKVYGVLHVNGIGAKSFFIDVEVKP